jgi:AcrR family transcriptional regulator
VPKLIDHEARRLELVEAAWRVILRDGAGRVSVRAVAAEARVSAGSLRHLFPTQAELLRSAMDRVNSTVRARILALPADLDGPDRALRIVRELLPLDVERRAEMEVNLALIAAAVTDSGLAAARDESFAGLRYACERVLVLLDDSGELAPSLDTVLEAARLHALIDGLAAHLTYQAPDAATDWADAVVRRHLESLRPPGGSSRRVPRRSTGAG